MTKAELFDEMADELSDAKAQLTASIAKCKRLQREKRVLEDKAECGRAHIEAGTAFAPGFRAYGTLEAMTKLNELLDTTSK